MIRPTHLLSPAVLLALLTLLPASARGQTVESGKRGTRTIYLVRHGQYDHADERDEFAGKALVPLGVAQARLVAARLRAMPVTFSSLTSSPMTRARQTARAIHREFPGLELKQDPEIGECTPPTWNRKVMAETSAGERETCVKNLERFFRERFVSSPDAADRHDIVVCHGNVIRYLVTRVLRVDAMSWLQMGISNCSLTIVRVLPDGSMKLDAFGDYGHIPENLRTFTGGDDPAKELIN